MTLPCIHRCALYEGKKETRGFLRCAQSQILNYFQAGSTWCDGCSDNNPGNFCLPYDGSEVPDCSLYVDPDHYLPYYHQHSASEIPFCNAAAKSQYVNSNPDCSRLWECGPAPAFETCLMECSPCCRVHTSLHGQGRAVVPFRNI